MSFKLSWIVVLLLSLPIIWPFLQKGYFPTQDGGWAVVRLAEMHREIKEFQFPPRWAGYLNHGYGYPLFLFTYPFPYYIGELFHLIGFGLIDSVKLVFILSVVGSAVTMFFFAKPHWGTGGAIVASLVYLYAPYRFVNLYIRGSIGESLAFVFFPLLLWIFQKVILEKKVMHVVVGGSLLATFILTHNAMVILYLPVFATWIMYMLWQTKGEIDSIKLVALTIALGLLLAAHFWLPAIMEKKYIALSQVVLAKKEDHFLNLKDLFSFDWQFNSRPPLQVGFIQLFVPFVAAYSILKFQANKSYKIVSMLVGLFVLLSFFFLLLLFPASQMFWQLPLFKEIDFPWRALAVLTFLLSFLSGSIVKIKSGFLLSIITIGTVIILNFGFIKIQPRENQDDAYYQTNDATTTSADELMPVWVQIKPTNRKTNIPVEIFHQYGGRDRAWIPQDISITSTKIAFKLFMSANDRVVLDRVYFPGWKAWLDNEELTVSPEPNTGLISTVLPRDGSNLIFAFSRTPVRVIADILSIAGIVSLVSVWIYSKKQHHFS